MSEENQVHSGKADPHLDGEFEGDHFKSDWH